MPFSRTKVLLIALMAPWCGCASGLDNSPVFTGNSALTYNIQDLDNFSPAGYIDARWGNFQSVDSSTIFNSTITLPCTPLTLGYNDLFISTSRTTLAAYSVPSQDYSNFQVSFSDTSGTDWNLYRFLHFNDVALFPTTATKLIIVIHGYNPSSNANPFASTPEFVNLDNNLAYETSGTDWQVVQYNWASDSDTGPDISLDVAVYATYAAEIGHQHGQHLGQLLSVLYPNLQEVQFIAHSDGAWVARGAARNLLADEPGVKVEVTLLDPFMPNTIPLISSVLGDSIMDALPTIPGNSTLYLLENYYADDQLDDLAFGTQDTFTWRSSDIGNCRIDWSPNGGSSYYYQTHPGPIQWYSDTIYQSVYPGTPVASLQPFDLSHVGWRRSLFNNEPLIVTPPPSTLALSTGAALSLSASASTRDRTAFPSSSLSPSISYQWYKASGATWLALSGQTQPTFGIASVQTSDAGQYLVTASNTAGTSQATVTVTVSNPAATPFAAWALANNLTLSAPTDNPTHDGIPNLIKYAVGLDPNKHEVSPATLSMDSANLYLTYDKARSELGYSVQTSTDLQTWTTAGVNQGGVGPIVTASVPIGPGGRRFLRLGVTLSP